LANRDQFLPTSRFVDCAGFRGGTSASFAPFHCTLNYFSKYPCLAFGPNSSIFAQRISKRTKACESIEIAVTIAEVSFAQARRIRPQPRYRLFLI
jgi:hypothetical protein